MRLVDDKFIFSQSGVYRLQQLANQVHSTTGVRHRLSNQDSLLRLLDFSSHCSDNIIQTYLVAFTSELDTEVINDLKERGVLVHH